MKKLIIIILLLCSRGLLIAQGLSNEATVSIITFGPGQEELFTGFGHSAIRIYDPVNQIDWAYNYGVFDFNQPNFYLNFTRGHLLYKLAVQDFQRMRQYYEYFNRYIIEQELNLSQEQKQKVFDYLQNNAKPENADYYYDYFYDNCATKIGDVFVESLGSDFRYDENYVEEPGLTIRTLTDRLIADEHPWGKLGIDLCLGAPMDKSLSNLEYMFLPEYVLEAFQAAEIRNNGVWDAVVLRETALFDPPAQASKKATFTPTVVFSVLLVLVVVLTYFSLQKGFSLKYFDFGFFLILGLLGTLLTLLWFGTDHNAAAYNFNILWALPTNLIAAFAFLYKPPPNWLKAYLVFVGITGLVLLVGWPFLPHQLNAAFIPVILSIIMRCYGNLKVL